MVEAAAVLSTRGATQPRPPPRWRFSTYEISPPTPNPLEETEMPSSRNSYSRDDWNSMLQGSFIQRRSDNQVVKVQEIVAGNEPNEFYLLGQAITRDGTRIRTSAFETRFTEDTFSEVFDWGRRKARVVVNMAGIPVVLRPSVRRSRVKGNHPNEVQATRLDTGATHHRLGEMFVGSDVAYMMWQMFHPPISENIKQAGALAVVSRSGGTPIAEVFNEPDEGRAALISVLAGATNNHTFNAASMRAVPTSHLRSVIRGLNLGDNRALFYMESEIGEVQDESIILDERADALADVVRREFPNMEVVIAAEVEE